MTCHRAGRDEPRLARWRRWRIGPARALAVGGELVSSIGNAEQGAEECAPRGPRRGIAEQRLEDARVVYGIKDVHAATSVRCFA